MEQRISAKIILADGTTFTGWSFGAPQSTDGEVVFATGMTGYPEAFTDPSFRGQILVMTYPLVGNYGVSDGPFESDRVQIQGLIVQEYSAEYSHQEAVYSLSQWLTREGVPAVYGVDTRALTKKLREHGVMLGQIVIGSDTPKEAHALEDPNIRNLVDEVSIVEPVLIGSGRKKIIAVDCGMKENIIRCLQKRGVTIKRVPWNYNYLHEEWDGLFLSNGPGDPMMLQETIGYLREAMKGKKPIFGICLGSQLMGLAAGAQTYKLKYGHRSQNQPCREVGTQRCYLTTQNHGFAVDEKTIPKDWKLWFVNANDGTTEGIRHTKKPFFSVQFHPESTPGPEDTEFLFDYFIDKVNRI
ncbi:MAG: glutamine-hydrolyzing carbamoyl-phosphate synthase small subunit [Candidatus Kerfeldbacteria bacterium]|nr:glutamine-hydrolyzing carbamoyl-phosphate synthase small subunit [Candidatus Kerfeldbacteria bacterium]